MQPGYFGDAGGSGYNSLAYQAELKKFAQSDFDTKQQEIAKSPVDTSLSELYAGLKHLAGIVEHLEQRLAPVLTPAPKATAAECAAQSDGNGETCSLIMEIRTASDRLGGLIQRVDTIRLRLCI